jgi:glutaredoxin
MAKDFMGSKGVAYEEKDVSTDLGAREEMTQKSHQMGVPVFDIGGKIFVGFNRTEIVKALGIT